MSSFQHVSGRDKSPKAVMAHQGAFKGFRLLSAQSFLGSFCLSPSLSLSLPFGICSVSWTAPEPASWTSPGFVEFKLSSSVLIKMSPSSLSLDSCKQMTGASWLERVGQWPYIRGVKPLYWEKNLDLNGLCKDIYQVRTVAAGLRLEIFSPWSCGKDFCPQKLGIWDSGSLFRADMCDWLFASEHPGCWAHINSYLFLEWDLLCPLE